MTGEIVKFPGVGVGSRPASRRPAKRYSRGENGPNLQRLLFRSSHLIVESDEPDLVRDVCFDIDRARGKLERIRARIESLQEYAATELQLLTDADTKLSAALVAALLSTQGQR